MKQQDLVAETVEQAKELLKAHPDAMLMVQPGHELLETTMCGDGFARTVCRECQASIIFPAVGGWGLLLSHEDGCESGVLLAEMTEMCFGLTRPSRQQRRRIQREYERLVAAYGGKTEGN
jgi:hypothetical protein